MRYLDAMLARSGSDDRLDGLVRDDNYMAEWKVDGHRCLLHIEDGRIAPVARSGRLLDGVSANVLNQFSPFLGETRWVFDGEYLNGCYYIFDLIEAGTLIKQTMPLGQRRDALETFWNQWNPRSSSVALLPSYRSTVKKAALVELVKDYGGEGVMFKHVDSVYRPGQRSDSYLKVKFRRDIDCVVAALSTGGKNNLALALWEPETGQFVNVGECTALAGDGPIAKVGDVVTVICYGSSQHNRIVQPTLPKIRTDKTPLECLFSQLDDIRIVKTVPLTPMNTHLSKGNA